jgi:1-acyl-sn-glycerol-3-phosphate acyltransferase
LIPRLPGRFAATIAQAFIKAVVRGLAGLRAEGIENIPNSGPLLVCPNHISDSDPATVYGVLGRQDVYFMGKSELFKIPIFGAFIRYLGAFPVRRDSADRAALRQAEEILSAGHTILLFPEGRCSQSGELQNLQPGAALLSLKTGARIMPVGVTGTNGLLPYGALVPRRSRKAVRLAVGQPIDPNDYRQLGHKAAIIAMTKQLEEEIMRLKEQAQCPP